MFSHIKVGHNNLLNRALTTSMLSDTTSKKHTHTNFLRHAPITRPSIGRSRVHNLPKRKQEDQLLSFAHWHAPIYRSDHICFFASFSLRRPFSNSSVCTVSMSRVRCSSPDVDSIPPAKLTALVVHLTHGGSRCGACVCVYDVCSYCVCSVQFQFAAALCTVVACSHGHGARKQIAIG